MTLNFQPRDRRVVGEKDDDGSIPLSFTMFCLSTSDNKDDKSLPPASRGTGCLLFLPLPRNLYHSMLCLLTWVFPLQRVVVFARIPPLEIETRKDNMMFGRGSCAWVQWRRQMVNQACMAGSKDKERNVPATTLYNVLSLTHCRVVTVPLLSPIPGSVYPLMTPLSLIT